MVKLDKIHQDHYQILQQQSNEIIELKRQTKLTIEQKDELLRDQTFQIRSLETTLRENKIEIRKLKGEVQKLNEQI